MASSSWKNRSLFRKLARRLRTRSREFSVPLAPLDHGLYSEAGFRDKLVQERKRAERSNKPLLVMVLDAELISTPENLGGLKESLGEGVHTCFRGTDICGVLKDGALIGVILTEVEPENVDAAQQVAARKTREALALLLSEELADKIAISFRINPELGGSDAIDLTFYPEVLCHTPVQLGGEVLKRSLDIVGSIAGLLLFSPVFACLPLLIKLSSRGPVFFRQDRVGRNGRKFKFIKFRSMYLDNDDVIHREYVKQLIKGEIAAKEQGSPGVYKIQGDPRVTRVGRFIRKYSLDELPQFINVLKGDMSLVGPRPPICYEVEHYAGWQRNRLIGNRPGITGLWQVTGRSTTTFDDMVRLDLRYLHGWSIALDLKILLRTPGAVLKCKGAY